MKKLMFSLILLGGFHATHSMESLARCWREIALICCLRNPATEDDRVLLDNLCHDCLFCGACCCARSACTCTMPCCIVGTASCCCGLIQAGRSSLENGVEYTMKYPPKKQSFR